MASRGGREISQRRRMDTTGRDHQRWRWRGIRAWFLGGRHQIEKRVGFTATEQLHHHVEGNISAVLQLHNVRSQPFPPHRNPRHGVVGRPRKQSTAAIETSSANNGATATGGRRHWSTVQRKAASGG